jgi:sialate O-acetylesterase
MVQRLTVGLVWVLALGNIGAARAQTPLMDALFVDHAVLQRDRPIDVYGHAAAGEEVTVTLGEARANARADAQGRWNARLPAVAAGGPFALTASTGSRTQTANDVLVGDVWLCSGQSNMEFAVRNTHDAYNEAALSANARIRNVTIPRRSSAAPLERFESPLEWKLAAPGNTEHFSAVCYYFVRELQKTVDVPQAIIHASWGGSRIEPWMSEGALRRQPGYGPALDLLGEYRSRKPLAFRRWGDTWQKWWVSQGATGGKQTWLAADTGAWKAAPAALDYWETWGVPELSRWDGMVWFRAHVQLTAAQAKQSAALSMGSIDDVDVTWVNGRAIGNTFGLEPRLYSCRPNYSRRVTTSSSSMCTTSGAMAACTVPRPTGRWCWPMARGCRSKAGNTRSRRPISGRPMRRGKR